MSELCTFFNYDVIARERDTHIRDRGNPTKRRVAFSVSDSRSINRVRAEPAG